MKQEGIEPKTREEINHGVSLPSSACADALADYGGQPSSRLRLASRSLGEGWWRERRPTAKQPQSPRSS
jgi:hypothetical protein